MTHPIQAYFRSARNELLAQFEKAGGVNHNGDKGSAREVFLNGFLHSAFPKKYVIGRGEIVDRDGSVSPQVDIAVYDETFPAFNYGSGNHYMAEGVQAHIEVKSNLTKEELRDVLAKTKKVKALKLDIKPDMHVGPLPRHIPSFLFAYTGFVKTETFRKNYEALSPGGNLDVRPNGIFVLKEGYGAMTDEKGTEFISCGEDILAVAFMVMQRKMQKRWSGDVNWNGYLSAIDIDTF